MEIGACYVRLSEYENKEDYLNKADEYLEKFKEYEIKARECSNIRPITIIELDKKSKEIGV